jgi:hypothetical protein
MALLISNPVKADVSERSDFLFCLPEALIPASNELWKHGKFLFSV